MKNGPALASQVIVQSEEEKNLAKKLRKLEKKERGKFSDEIERYVWNNPLFNWYYLFGWDYEFYIISSVSDDLRTEQMRPMFRRIPEVVETFPHVYDNKFTKFASEYLFYPSITIILLCF